MSDTNPTPTAAPADGRVKAISFTRGDVSYLIQRDVIDDLELLEMVEDGKVISAVRRILGAEQWERYKDAHRDASGRVSGQDLASFLNDLFARLSAGKS